MFAPMMHLDTTTTSTTAQKRKLSDDHDDIYAGSAMVLSPTSPTSPSSTFAHAQPPAKRSLATARREFYPSDNGPNANPTARILASLIQCGSTVVSRPGGPDCGPHQQQQQQQHHYNHHAPALTAAPSSSASPWSQTQPRVTGICGV
ncbi:hypothetical protein HDU89_005027 [Geranomyces variabilis]|nr:hypothetical protein HDU89_005027 [Geranomyces variabilis]